MLSQPQHLSIQNIDASTASTASTINTSTDAHNYNDTHTTFHWKGLTRQKPRNYQMQAYTQALLQDLILILPTGMGKTLVACMLISKLKQLNPSYMALLLVDRVPLVFQQASVIERQTGLRVCRMCGKTKTRSMIHELNDSKYDMLVITAGALVELQERQHGIDVGRQFCIVVVDKCHHANKGHVYANVLNYFNNNNNNSSSSTATTTYLRPRILGLTASPAQGKNPTQLRTNLQTLRHHFHQTILFCPDDIPHNSTNISWIIVIHINVNSLLCCKRNYKQGLNTFGRIIMFYYYPLLLLLKDLHYHPC